LARVADRVLTGSDLQRLSDEALWRVAESTDLFVEVDPNQKERIILAVKKMGHVVGFLGDGVTDAPAVHAADTSLSVQRAAPTCGGDSRGRAEHFSDVSGCCAYGS
jgi:Mg2+-importing ATPase